MTKNTPMRLSKTIAWLQAFEQEHGDIVTSVIDPDRPTNPEGTSDFLPFLTTYTGADGKVENAVILMAHMPVEKN